jgi:phosphatidate cytidylyltransferase
LTSKAVCWLPANGLFICVTAWQALLAAYLLVYAAIEFAACLHSSGLRLSMPDVPFGPWAFGYAVWSAAPRIGWAMLLLYGVLAIASVGVGLSSARQSALRLQINAWWRIFPVVSVSLLLYPWGPGVLFLLIAGLAMRELGMHYLGPAQSFYAACALVLVLQTLLAMYDPGWACNVLLGMLLLQALAFCVYRRTSWMLVLLFVWLCAGMSFLPRLLHMTSSAGVNLAWFFYLFVLTALNDIAQFVCGKCWGRHKVAARISPNKTWQGLLGGVLTSMAVSALLGWYLQLAAVPKLLGLGVLLSLAGFVGDMALSAAKRRLGIKDFSQLIPGHGGILDRVDSLVLTAPALYWGLTL